MACAEGLRLQAYFDGEIDAVTAAATERHLEGCCECRTQLADLERTRAAIRRHFPLEGAPASLQAHVQQALEREAPPRAPTPVRAWRARPFWLGAASGAAAAGLAAMALTLAFSVDRPGAPEALEAAHVRSLMPAHLLDVETSERHTVKPWFADHVDVSPVVGDFADEGYRLLGARADYLLGQRVAVLVYRHGAHVINVFSWVAGTQGLPRETSRAGYHMVFWRAGDLQYCAVSDAGWQELRGLVALLRDLAARDAARE
jgi:anti-sigma factor RsiW